MYEIYHIRHLKKSFFTRLKVTDHKKSLPIAKRMFKEFMSKKDSRIQMLEQESGVKLDYSIESLEKLQTFFKTTIRIDPEERMSIMGFHLPDDYCSSIAQDIWIYLATMVERKLPDAVWRIDLRKHVNFAQIGLASSYFSEYWLYNKNYLKSFAGSTNNYAEKKIWGEKFNRIPTINENFLVDAYNDALIPYWEKHEPAIGEMIDSGKIKIVDQNLNLIDPKSVGL